MQVFSALFRQNMQNCNQSHIPYLRRCGHSRNHIRSGSGPGLHRPSQSRGPRPRCIRGSGSRCDCYSRFRSRPNRTHWRCGPIRTARSNRTHHRAPYHDSCHPSRQSGSAVPVPGCGSPRIYSGSISRKKRLGSLRWVRPYSIRETLLEMYSSFLARVMPT